MFDTPTQTEEGPVIVGAAGIPGDTVTAKLLADEVPQLLVAVTVIFPFCAAAPVVTVMLFVVPPPVIDHPVGTVQLYVTFATAVTL